LKHVIIGMFVDILSCIIVVVVVVVFKLITCNMLQTSFL
jgi:hypothetical protein